MRVREEQKRCDFYWLCYFWPKWSSNYWFTLLVQSLVLLFQQIYRSRWRKLGLFLQSLQIILVWKLSRSWCGCKCLKSETYNFVGLAWALLKRDEVGKKISGISRKYQFRALLLIWLKAWYKFSIHGKEESVFIRKILSPTTLVWLWAPGLRHKHPRFLFWKTNMAALTSCEIALHVSKNLSIFHQLSISFELCTLPCHQM